MSDGSKRCGWGIKPEKKIGIVVWEATEEALLIS